MMRAGKPWAVVRRLPFIRTATIVLGFIALGSGIPAVYPSAQLNTIQSAVGSRPADWRRADNRTPFHWALLIRFPPTSLLTHSRVTGVSTLFGAAGSARATRSAYRYVEGLVTRPPTDNVHEASSTVGSTTFFVTT